MINHYSTDDGAAERRAPEFALVDIKWGDRVTVDPGHPGVETQTFHEILGLPFSYTLKHELYALFF